MKTINNFRCLLLSATVMVLGGCESMLNPELDNVYGEERALTIPQTAAAFLNSAYTSIPTTYNLSECTTDDAVMNNTLSSLPLMASGGWSALFDPLSNWSASYKAIMNVNQFMTYLPKIQISWSSEKSDSSYRRRWTGEAYGMRAFFHLQLLQYYGGKVSSGQILGIPYLTAVIANNDSSKMIERPLFTVTVNKIVSDLDSAIQKLPLDYAGADPVIGIKNTNRFSKRIAYATKARLYMHAASPLYNGGVYNVAYCDSAVKYAVLAIGTNTIGTTNTNQLFYTTDAPSSAEIIWRMNKITAATTVADMANTVEYRNYPPSLSGQGQVNPTQEFVDAFPDKNGYPITSSTIYNPTKPYDNRDARLDRIVIRDGGALGTKTIRTSKDDTKNGIENTGATRTGYYLKKLLRPDVTITNPIAGKQNIYPIIRMTEMYLIFAEAMTASKGPDVTVTVAGVSQSARTVIKGIRKRNGIPTSDAYATSLPAASFMNLVRNERRIELSFEGFRFMDMRRWNLPVNEINGTVHRARILTAGGVPEILPIDDEPRAYSQFIYFAPIPNSEILKCPRIEQNVAQ